MFPQIVQVMRVADKVHPIDSPDHVVFGGFDGDATAYSLMAEGTLDADGVQDLFYEAELAVNAIVDLQAGRPVEKVLLDPGFAITQRSEEHTSELQSLMRHSDPAL